MIGAAIDKLSPEVEPDVVNDAQADLISHAQTLTHTQLQILANHLVEVVDPDTADEALAAQLQADEAGPCSRPPSVAVKASTASPGSPAGCPTCTGDMLSTDKPSPHLGAAPAPTPPAPTRPVPACRQPAWRRPTSRRSARPPRPTRPS